MALQFPFSVKNRDLGKSVDIKLDSIKSIILTYKYERIRQPDYGNTRVLFRGATAQLVVEYIKMIELELRKRTQDNDIELTGILQPDGSLELTVYFDERVYYAVI